MRATAAVSLLLAAPASAGRWGTSADPPEERAAKVLAQMTQGEKITMTHGTDYLTGNYIGHINGCKRLGIPPILMNDGPQGFRAKEKAGTSTQFPSGLSIGTTWNRTAAHAWGAAMGEEFYGKGANVQLGPGVCVARVPVNGRNFEYLSGEDPYLGSAMVAPVVKGIQRPGVLANVKHYIGNNQETERMRVDSLIDERTRMEIYAPPFEAAVDAGVHTVMCSYNKVNGDHACENNQTLNVELKGRWGFKGWVMSDWTGTHSTVKAANSGLDQEMPFGTYFDFLGLEIKLGNVQQSTLDGMVKRILTAMFAGGLFDTPASGGDAKTNVTSDAHRALARELAVDSTVMLKNDGVLPVDFSAVKTVAVIGDHAQNPISGGGGSGAVKPAHAVGVLEALQRRYPGVAVSFDKGTDAAAAAKLAAAADLAVVVVASTSEEGSDRKNLDLDGVACVKAVAAAQPKTIVVAVTPGAAMTTFTDDAAAALMLFMPGEQEGNAVVDVLSGAEPGGRLPLTMPNKENEVSFTKEQYPGVHLTANYSERLEVGYRWYHAHKVAPRFPFGFGLSYTSFSIGELSASKEAVTVVVKNTGRVAGDAVPQMYLTYPSAAGEPPAQLKGFDKVRVEPGASTTVTFPIRDRDVSVWDAAKHDWSVVHGTYKVCVGAHSAAADLCTSLSV